METKLDFCIVENIFPGSNKDRDFWVFITDHGLDYTDGSVRDREDFKSLVKTLRSRGFMEVDELRFEFIGDGDQIKEFLLDRDSLKELLKNSGATYNIEFEQNIKSDIKKLSDNIGLSILGDIYREYEESIFGGSNPILSESEITLYEPMEQEEKYLKIPEKTRLNIYLFVDVIVNDFGDLIVDVTGNFQLNSTLTDRNRTYVKIATFDFERGQNHLTKNNPDIISFNSVKSKGEILKEISFLQEVELKMINYKRISKKGLILEPNKQFYSILDFIDKVPFNERIVLSVDKKDYETMVGLSDRIEIEKENQSQKIIDVKEVISSINDLSNGLSEKMQDLAFDEEYKKASSVKKDLQYIQGKANSFKETFGNGGRISKEEYHTLLPNK